MEKPTVNMRNWELYVYDEEYSLSGTADNHPNLGKNAYISHTSKMVGYSFEADVLRYETRNTVYVCPLKYMTQYPYTNVIEEAKQKLTHRADCSENDLDRIIAVTAKIATASKEKDEYLEYVKKLQEQGKEEITRIEEEENRRLCEIAMQYEDCIYIEVSNVEQGNKLAYHIGEHTGVVQPTVHSGTFQDSVLYMKYDAKDYDGCSLDFRYFPKFCGYHMETYSWSDNIKNVVIKNECSYNIAFNKEPVLQGETKVFHSGEV